MCLRVEHVLPPSMFWQQDSSSLLRKSHLEQFHLVGLKSFSSGRFAVMFHIMSFGLTIAEFMMDDIVVDVNIVDDANQQRNL